MIFIISVKLLIFIICAPFVPPCHPCVKKGRGCNPTSGIFLTYAIMVKPKRSIASRKCATSILDDYFFFKDRQRTGGY